MLSERKKKVMRENLLKGKKLSWCLKLEMKKTSLWSQICEPMDKVTQYVANSVNKRGAYIDGCLWYVHFKFEGKTVVP